MNLGFPEMAAIFVLALIIFGPKRMPEIGRQIGKALAEFKRYSNDFKYQLESEVRQWEIEETLRKEKEELKKVMTTMPPEGAVAARTPAPDSENTVAAPSTETSAVPDPYLADMTPATQHEGENSILPPKGSNA